MSDLNPVSYGESDEFDSDFDFEKPVAAKPIEAAPTANLKFKTIHKKVVCRYWLNDKCRKGVHCEFKHEFDSENMPECRKGVACRDPSCILAHPSKDDKPLCPNYEAGFCSFGYSCQYRHEHKEGPPPEISALFFAADPVKAYVAQRSKSQKSWRKAPCPYMQSDGWCPYFYACAFKH